MTKSKIGRDESYVHNLSTLTPGEEGRSKKKVNVLLTWSIALFPNWTIYQRIYS